MLTRSGTTKTGYRSQLSFLIILLLLLGTASCGGSSTVSSNTNPQLSSALLSPTDAAIALIGTTTLQLTWVSPSQADSFEIMIFKNGSELSDHPAVQGHTSYTFTGEWNSVYRFKVRAKRNDGTESEWSPISTDLSIGDAPFFPPSGLQATVQTADSSYATVLVRWSSVPAALMYNVTIYKKSGDHFVKEPTQPGAVVDPLECTHQNATINTMYRYEVVAIRKSDNKPSDPSQLDFMILYPGSYGLTVKGQVLGDVDPNLAEGSGPTTPEMTFTLNGPSAGLNCGTGFIVGLKKGSNAEDIYKIETKTTLKVPIDWNTQYTYRAKLAAPNCGSGWFGENSYTASSSYATPPLPPTAMALVAGVGANTVTVCWLKGTISASNYWICRYSACLAKWNCTQATTSGNNLCKDYSIDTGACTPTVTSLSRGYQYSFRAAVSNDSTNFSYGPYDSSTYELPGHWSW